MPRHQRYRVVERIDVGGMAEVYRGLFSTLEGIQKEVAIKRVLPHLTRNEKFVRMFLDEARTSMVLNHANIVQVFDVGRAAGTYFIVMEYVDGHNLRRIFQRASERGMRIPVEIAVYIMIEVCKALAHAHERKGPDGKPLGIVHRDVSPPNVLISKAGEVKLTDFGLAKAATQVEHTDPGVVKGKFSYLSPEAAEGAQIDCRADIFSAGTVLFELLTGRKLFLGKTDMETVELVRKAQVPPVRRLNPDVPRELERILRRALARDPRKRYPAARDMAEDLARFLFEQAQRKVTAMDVARFVEDLFRPAQDKIEDRVDALLHEEIINLSSMGYIRDAQPGEGRQPLTDADLSEPVRKAGRIPATALWDAMSASRAQVSEMLDEVGSAIASQGSVAVSGGPSRRTLVAWGIGFLVLLLALAYVVVRYVYAL